MAMWMQEWTADGAGVKVAGGGRYVTRFPEGTGRRRPDGISPGETPAGASFLGEKGARIDFLDLSEIERLPEAETKGTRGLSPPHVGGSRAPAVPESRKGRLWATGASGRDRRRAASRRGGRPTRPGGGTRRAGA